MHLPAQKFDCIFSFSFLQYISPTDIPYMQQRLLTMLKPGGSIIHCSVPDIRMRPVNIAEHQFRKYAFHGWWRTPLIVLFSYLHHNYDSYASNAFWHDPAGIIRQLGVIGNTSILPGDVYYRFDIKTCL